MLFYMLYPYGLCIHLYIYMGVYVPMHYDNRFVVAHGRKVTSSQQITEVKQRRARLVLG